MKKTFALAAVFIAILSLLMVNQAGLLAKSSDGATETMKTANRLYENGQFALAAQGYQQLIDRGYTDSSLYYNLGNAHFKQGDIGRAILNYRRAEKLGPRDSDIQANLQLARAETLDRLEDTAETEGFFHHIARFTRKFTLNELAIFALTAWFALALLIIVLINSRISGAWRETLQYAIALMTMITLLGVAGLGSRMYAEKTRPEGVIVAPEVSVTSGPGNQYVTEFTLHSGTEVGIADKRGNWVLLTLPGGEVEGWVPAEAIEGI
ncbi:MAG TPA: tetratricopeptide repeat protein [Chloroflexi bacterium]|nr:tetratricopeptide repeat protein [Chloroflexota bacterium]